MFRTRKGTIMGKIKRIHINQHNIRHNSKSDEHKPIVSVKCGGKNYTGYGADFNEGKVVYSPDKPLSCGAKVWLETTGEVIIRGKDGAPIHNLKS